jgi:cytidylate kinase
VQNIVIWHERMGKSIDEICAEYGLTLAEVHAALAYYFDHQEEIDQRIEDDEALVAAQRRRTSSVLENRISPYSLRG